jgi:hypothetical protein
VELCDGRDNDCDGQVDEEGCPASPAWTQVGGAGGPGGWATVAAYAPERAWIAGAGGRLRVRSGTGSFTSHDGHCVGDWRASWAAALDGRVFIGGASAGAGVVASHTPNGVACGFLLLVPGADLVTGLVGFGAHDMATVYGVSLNGVAFELAWSASLPAAPTLSALPQVPGTLHGIHGASTQALFAVGGTPTSPARPAIWRYDPGTSTWEASPIANAESMPDGVLEGVSVVHERLALAVGRGGTALRFDGTRWSALPAPFGAPDLVSVRAFGGSQVYAVDASGKVLRFDGVAWEAPLFTGAVSLADIDGTSPGDLWVVGDSGTALHWPQ